MNNYEILNAFKNGKKIRCVLWPKTEYIYLKDGMVFDEEGKSDIPVSSILCALTKEFVALQVELYEENKSESQNTNLNSENIVKDEPAFPSPKWPSIEVNTGLTKREEFAKSAMQGLLGNTEITKISFKEIAEYSVKCADLLSNALNKPKESHVDTN